MTQNTVKLASGHEMPLVGFGLWKVPKETAADTVYNVGNLWLFLVLSADINARPSKQVTDCLTAHTTTRTRRKPERESVALSKMAL